MATSDYLSSADLNAVPKGGVVNESVMQKIWDISKIPLPFTDMIGTASHTNSYTSWVQDALQAQNLSNAAVDGQDVTAFTNIPPQPRVGNQSQISTKSVAVSERAQAVDSIGGNALSYQIMMRQQELRRDVEGIMLTGQASVADDGATVAGKAGGLGSWLTTNVSFGATGSAGGYNTTTGLTVAPTYGTARAPSEDTLLDLLQGVYQNGGNVSTLMTVPSVTRGLSNFLLSGNARVATLMSDTGQSATPQTAKGAVNVYVGDFGVYTIVPNRLMPLEAAGKAAMYLLDPSLIEISYLKGYRVEPLAKTGLADKRLMAVDWTLKVLQEKGLGGYFDIDTTAAWVA